MVVKLTVLQKLWILPGGFTSSISTARLGSEKVLKLAILLGIKKEGDQL